MSASAVPLRLPHGVGSKIWRRAKKEPINPFRPGNCRFASNTPRPIQAFQAQRSLARFDSVLLVALAGAGLIWGFGSSFLTEAHAESTFEKAGIERPRRKTGLSKEETRDLLSSQHLQVKKSWENPGVYAWGSNSGKVVAPDSEESVIKSPRRIPFFDGSLLRDLKLDRNFGAAIDEKGNLLQWGKDFSVLASQPTVTLKGKDLQSLVLSRDRIIALSRGGKVYSVPVAQVDQSSGPKLSESTWVPFWSNRSSISYRVLEPKNLSWGEKVSRISGGLEHVLLLTTKGRLFSAASGSESFPTKGQLGIPGLTWASRPEGPYDQCHEIMTLRGFDIAQIAAGDFHSLALDKEGRVFSFGDNSVGQLGFDVDPQAPVIDAPSLLPVQRLYAGNRSSPRGTNIAAGGVNSFFTFEANRSVGQGEGEFNARGPGAVTADTFSCGQGIWGALGNGKWTHVQATPAKMKALSGLFEYDEKQDKVVPIRLARISVGSTHACAVLDNVTHVEAHETSSENDTNWGADILWWGGNEYYQLGTGKRNNVANPTYIPPLDVEADKERGRSGEHRFQITPRKKVQFGGRSVSMEQRAECGRFVSAVYSVV